MNLGNYMYTEQEKAQNLFDRALKMYNKVSEDRPNIGAAHVYADIGYMFFALQTPESTRKARLFFFLCFNCYLMIIHKWRNFSLILEIVIYL